MATDSTLSEASQALRVWLAGYVQRMIFAELYMTKFGVPHKSMGKWDSRFFTTFKCFSMVIKNGQIWRLRDCESFAKMSYFKESLLRTKAFLSKLCTLHERTFYSFCRKSCKIIDTLAHEINQQCEKRSTFDVCSVFMHLECFILSESFFDRWDPVGVPYVGSAGRKV